MKIPERKWSREGKGNGDRRAQMRLFQRYPTIESDCHLTENLEAIRSFHDGNHDPAALCQRMQDVKYTRDLALAKQI